MTGFNVSEFNKLKTTYSLFSLICSNFPRIFFNSYAATYVTVGPKDFYSLRIYYVTIMLIKVPITKMIDVHRWNKKAVPWNNLLKLRNIRYDLPISVAVKICG